MSPFTKRVYQVVLGIPLGQLRSYKWVASKAGRPSAARSVGQILKNNPFPFIIPCHRVIRSNGKIGGYQQGVGNKKRLIKLELSISELISTTKKAKR